MEHEEKLSPREYLGYYDQPLSFIERHFTQTEWTKIKHVLWTFLISNLAMYFTFDMYISTIIGCDLFAVFVMAIMEEGEMPKEI